MQERATPRRKCVRLSVEAALLDEAKVSNCDLSEIFERALRDEMRASRLDAWLEANKAAIEASNRELEANGMWYTPEWLAE